MSMNQYEWNMFIEHTHFTIYCLVRRSVLATYKLMNEKHKFSKNDTLSRFILLQFGAMSTNYVGFFPILLNPLSFSRDDGVHGKCANDLYVNLFVCINIINLSYAFDNTHFRVHYLFSPFSLSFVSTHTLPAFQATYDQFVLVQWISKDKISKKYHLCVFFSQLSFEIIGFVQRIYHGRGFRLSWAYRIFCLLTMM